MMRHAIRLTLFCLILSSPLFAADFRFERFDFPNAAATFALGINARGDIVRRYVDTDGVTHGFLLHKGVFSTIDFPHALFTAARWINESRDIVGVYANTLDECYAFQAHGFLLRQGAYTAIDFPGSVYTEAFSINDDGVIVGDYTDMNGNAHGFKAVPKD
jgi:uncharacterized membrane protein